MKFSFWQDSSIHLFSYLVDDIGEVRNVKHILLLYGKKIENRNNKGL